jgi:hypothetical protein
MWSACKDPTAMEFQKDFEDLCVSLNARSVEYLVVGGYALAFHGSPRYTGDLDLFIRPSADNVRKLLAALHDFGFRNPQVDPDDLLLRRQVLELGRPPVQVHIMASITGVTWEEAWASRQPGAYGHAAVSFLGRDALLANKQATGRAKDLADIAALRRPSRGTGSR